MALYAQLLSNLWWMTKTYDIFQPLPKNGQNDQKIDKMTKKAKIHQKCQNFKILVNFAYFVDILTFLDNLARMWKSNLFSICDIICSPKSPILASKIAFLSIFEILSLEAQKPSIFTRKNWCSSFSLVFSFFQEPLTDNGVQRHYFVKMYKKMQI